MKRWHWIAAGLALIAIVAATPLAFNAAVKAYLMAHPDELQAAIENMQNKATEKQDAEADLKVKAALPGLRQALEHDPRDFVANPNGKITVTEFYDYRCPHCIDIAPKVVALIHDHPDVRFVFKELPIFGGVSDRAAAVAIAAKDQGKDYLGLYQAFMAERPLTDEGIDRIAAAKGVNLAAIKAGDVATKTQTQITDTHNLADALTIDGTPGFIVGDTLIRGSDDDALNTAIAKAEHKT